MKYLLVSIKTFSEKFFVILIFGFWTSVWGFLNLRILPPVDSIAYPLVVDGYLPYRDYYFPVTPGTYFLSTLTNLVSFSEPTVTYRIVGLLFVPLLLWSAYSISRRFVSRINASILSGFCCSIFFALGLEMFGGWNLIPLTLYLAGLALLVVASPLSTAARHNSFQSESKAILFFSGICFASAIVFKQTFLIQFFVHVVLFIIFLMITGSGVKALSSINRERVLLFSAGFITPIILTYIWLLKNNLFESFTQNMLSFGGKNPSLNELVSFALLSVFTNLSGVIPIAFIALLGLLAYAFWIKERNPLMVPLFAFVSGLMVYYQYWNQLSRPEQTVTAACFFIAIAISLVLIRQSNPSMYRKFLPALWIVLLATIQVYVSSKEPGRLYKLIALSLPQSFFIGVTMLLTVFVLCLHLSSDREKFSDSSDRRSFGHNIPTADVRLNLFFAAGTLAAFINLASSGGTTYLIWFIGSFVYFTAYITGLLKLRENKQLILVIFSTILLGMVSNLATGIAHPYTWWGWNEPSLTKPAKQSEIKALSGMRPAATVNKFYETVHSYTETAKLSSDSKSPTVLTIGAIPILSAVSGMDPYQGLYCKVQWLDLCPDAVLLSDLKKLKSNPPDVIVFQEISAAAFKSHEGAFLKSQSSLRRYKDFRYVQVRLGNWIEVGRVRTPGTMEDRRSGFGSWNVIVYRVVN